MDPHRMQARELRLNPTEAEKLLWQALRGKQLGVKFRRQALVGPYILDFACLTQRIAVEVDGGQHADNESDKVRDDWLRSQGFRVLRFWNNQVLDELPSVLAKIHQAVGE